MVSVPFLSSAQIDPQHQQQAPKRPHKVAAAAKVTRRSTPLQPAQGT